MSGVRPGRWVIAGQRSDGQTGFPNRLHRNYDCPAGPLPRCTILPPTGLHGHLDAPRPAMSRDRPVANAARSAVTQSSAQAMVALSMKRPENCRRLCLHVARMTDSIQKRVSMI